MFDRCDTSFTEIQKQALITVRKCYITCTDVKGNKTFDHSLMKDMARMHRSERALVSLTVGGRPKRQGKPEILGKNSAPVPLCSPQIPQRISWDGTRAFAVRS
jgi:hypothetical protein